MAISATTIEKAILLLNITTYVLVVAIGCILINDAIDSGDRYAYIAKSPTLID
jgi:hypothetical protein